MPASAIAAAAALTATVAGAVANTAVAQSGSLAAAVTLTATAAVALTLATAIALRLSAIAQTCAVAGTVTNAAVYTFPGAVCTKGAFALMQPLLFRAKFLQLAHLIHQNADAALYSVLEVFFRLSGDRSSSLCTVRSALTAACRGSGYCSRYQKTYRQSHCCHSFYQFHNSIILS